MRKDFKLKTPFPALPIVVIATYDKKGVANAMTAAWATLYDFGYVFVSLAKEHKTAANLVANKAFTLAFATKETVKLADYFGMVSGNKVNKIKASGVKVTKSKFVNAPIIDKFPVTIECKVKEYKDEILIGEIVNTSIDSKYVVKNKPSLDKIKFVLYDSFTNVYKETGSKLFKAFTTKKAK